MQINVVQQLNYGLQKVIRNLLSFNLKLQARIKNNVFYCKALNGVSYLCVNSDMTISCNCQDYDGKGHLGDLITQNVNEIYNGEVANSFRRQLAEGKLPMPTCARCYELGTIKREEAKITDNYKYPIPKEKIMLENTVVCNLECLGCARRTVLKTRKRTHIGIETGERKNQFF